MKQSLKLLFTFLCLSSLLNGSLLNGSEIFSSLQSKMLQDLEFIKHVFEVKYAPTNWKERHFGWDLTKEYEQAKKAITTGNKDLLSYHKTLKKLFNSARDYHVGIHFYSTEKAELPFTIKGSEGRYFCVFVDRENIENVQDTLFYSMIEEGDEILEFNDKPIGEVIEEIIKEEFGSNTKETDQGLAEWTLTSRNGSSGDNVPSGDVNIKVRKRFSDTTETYTYTWKYTPEVISDVSEFKLNAGVSKSKPYVKKQDHRDFFNRLMVSTYFREMMQGHFKTENKHQIGGHSSFIPKLGKKIWESDEASAFDAYVFSMPSSSSIKQKKIGYIRIPHYLADESEAEEFCEIISQFQWRTDALVVDQINNPGGSLFYVYSLAAMLTDRPLATPKHHILLTQQEIYMAQILLDAIEDVHDDFSAKECLGETIGGYPVDFRFAQLIRDFCYFLIEEWNEGHLYSGLTHLFGVDEIRPHPKAHYTKPILLLTNSLDFSAGDFFPAIMQDNHRATILGTRTAGAGGYVLDTSFPNRTGIAYFSTTASLAERVGNQPIENLGVKPDIFYEITPDDIEGNYEGYVAAILKAVETMVKKT